MGSVKKKKNQRLSAKSVGDIFSPQIKQICADKRIISGFMQNLRENF
jgi:hypothetical protein